MSRLQVRCDVSVHTSVFTGTHWVYPERDGQVELMWVVGSFQDGLLFTRHVVNWARH